MKKLFILLIFCPLTLLAQVQPLRVAVAANAQFVMTQLKMAFQVKTGVRIETIVNSSGKLTTQIQQGAPYDVFLSADMDYPNTLYRIGQTTAAPVVYAYGSLVLWTLGNLPLTTDLSVLSDPKVRHIALANPATAPYGKAAVAYLNHTKRMNQATARLVYGESIAQVNQYVLTGAAEVGFTAKSVVLDPSLKQRGHWIDLPTTGYLPIAQGVVILKRTTQGKAARQFMAFLRSPEARRILQQFGYRASAS